MGRQLVTWAAFGFAIALALGNAEARDRKSASAPERNAASEMVAGREAYAIALRHDPFASAAVAPLASKRSVSDEDGSDRRAPAPPIERKALTIFRFDSILGDVAVQPVVGSVKGAQFSVGF